MSALENLPVKIFLLQLKFVAEELREFRQTTVEFRADPLRCRHSHENQKPRSYIKLVSNFFTS